MNNLSAQQGLVFLGATDPNVDQDFKKFKHWIANDNHGSMEFMRNNMELRRDAQLVHFPCRQVLMFGLPYGGDAGTRHSNFRIARYAQSPDYHKTIKKKLTALMKQFSVYLGAIPDYRVTVDTAPILERAFAAKTASGFIGKNTCFIHHDRGSFVLLGAVLIDRVIDELIHRQQLPQTRYPSTATACGSCRRCQVHCPTGALTQDYTIDARRCIAYWTIEHRGAIPYSFWKLIGNHLFGCDICQTVCPKNRKTGAKLLLPSKQKSFEKLSLEKIACMSAAQYEEWFAGTPVTRAKRPGLMRNAIIILYNQSNKNLSNIILGIEKSENLIHYKHLNTRLSENGANRPLLNSSDKAWLGLLETIEMVSLRMNQNPNR